MTITCAWCKRDLGEVCPECGQPASSFADCNPRLFVEHFWRAFALVCMRLFFAAQTPSLRVCRARDCRQILFLAGLGGTSHGICEPCRDENRVKFESVVRRAQAREALN